MRDASAGTIASYGLKKRPVAVQGCRKVRKEDMKNNSALPKIEVDPESYKVRYRFPSMLFAGCD